MLLEPFTSQSDSSFKHFVAVWLCLNHGWSSITSGWTSILCHFFRFVVVRNLPEIAATLSWLLSQYMDKALSHLWHLIFPLRKKNTWTLYTRTIYHIWAVSKDPCDSSIWKTSHIWSIQMNSWMVASFHCGNVERSHLPDFCLACSKVSTSHSCGQSGPGFPIWLLGERTQSWACMASADMCWAC